MKKTSLSFRLVITMIFVVAGAILLCSIINTTFLETYYTYNKQQEMQRSFVEMNGAVRLGIFAEESYDVPFEKICNNSNTNILVISKDYTVVRSSYANPQGFLLELNDLLFENYDSGEILLQKDNYAIEKIVDSRMGAEYMILYGILADGSYIYMRTPVESLTESALITNRFFLEIGIGAILVSSLLAILLSRNISKPIRELSGISRKMKNLEFEAQFVPAKHSVKEVDELGHNMNEMSAALEKAIEELKTANNHLVNDIKEKEEIDAMRKEFISNVSHELKTPLALIEGYAEGLLEGISEDASSREYYCEVILDESRKMAAMVKKLLTLNQLEFGGNSVEIERFDLTALVRGLLQAQEIMASQEGITLEMDWEEPVYVWSDSYMVEEALTNYFSNAIHYAAGEKLVRVSCERQGERTRVLVFNTGAQIPEEEIPKIWDKFYKVDKARTREYGGNGIGLSIVKAIADSLHQSCGVSNCENGVVFWLEL